MDSIFHCSNCGALKSKPDKKCSECGYQPKSAPEVEYVLILQSAPETLETVQALVKLLGVNSTTAKRIIRSCPIAIMTTTSEQDLFAPQHELIGLGAEIKIERKQLGRAQDYTTAAEPIAKPSVIAKLIPILIFLFVFILPILQKSDEFKLQLRKIMIQLQITKEPFQTIEIIAVTQELPTGHSLILEDLTVIRVPREEIPQGAFCPLEVERLIGARLVFPIEAYQPLVAEHIQQGAVESP